MKKFFLTFLIIITSLTAFSEPWINDPFENDLNIYAGQRDLGINLLMSGVIGLGVGFVGGSTFLTLNSMGIIDSTTTMPLVITSYATVSISVVIGIIGFLIWKDGIENYLETLRIQTQYYNLVK